MFLLSVAWLLTASMFECMLGGAVPDVQLPAAHVVPLPFPPPDVEIG